MPIAPHFMPNALKAIRDIVSTTIPDLKRLRDEFVKNQGGATESILTYQEEALLKILPDVVKAAIVSTVLYKESYEFLMTMICNYVWRYRIADKKDQAMYPLEIINPYVQLVINKIYSELPTKTGLDNTDRKIINTGLDSLKGQTKKISTMLAHNNQETGAVAPSIDDKWEDWRSIQVTSFLPGVVDPTWVIAQSRLAVVTFDDNAQLQWRF